MGIPDEEGSTTVPVEVDPESDLVLRGPKGNQGNQGVPGEDGRDLPHRTLKARLRLLVPYVALVGVLVYSQYQEHVNNEQRAQDQIDSQYNTCKEANNVRLVIRDLVSSNGNPIDLTAIPSFQHVDPATQAYLTELSAALNAEPPPEAQSALLDKVPLKDCEALFPTHSH